MFSDRKLIQFLIVVFVSISSIVAENNPSKKFVVFPSLQQKLASPGKTYPVKICFESNNFEGYHYWKDSQLVLLLATRRGPHVHQCQDDLYPSRYEILEYLTPIIQNHSQPLLDYLKTKQAQNPSIKKFELDKDLSNEACVTVEELDAKIIEEISSKFNQSVKGIYDVQETNKKSVICPFLQTAMYLFPKQTFTISVCFRPESDYIKLREEYEKKLISSRLNDPKLNFGATKPEFLKPSKYTITMYLKTILDEDSKNVREFINNLKDSSAKIIPSKRQEIYENNCLKVTGASNDLIADLEKKFTEIKDIKQSILDHYD